MFILERNAGLKAAPMEIKHTVFWNVMSCNLADHYRCFGGTSLSIFGVQTVNSKKVSPKLWQRSTRLYCRIPEDCKLRVHFRSPFYTGRKFEFFFLFGL
jgi:hypothetical protein